MLWAGRMQWEISTKSIAYRKFLNRELSGGVATAFADASGFPWADTWGRADASGVSDALGNPKKISDVVYFTPLFSSWISSCDFGMISLQFSVGLEPSLKPYFQSGFTQVFS